MHAETDRLYQLIQTRGSKNKIIGIAQELVKDTQLMIKSFITRLFPPKKEEEPRPPYYYLTITESQVFTLHSYLERIILRQTSAYNLCYNLECTIEQQMKTISVIQQKNLRDTIKFRFRARHGPYPMLVTPITKKN